MAKAKSNGKSKSQAIRDFFKNNPKARNTEAVAALAKDGIEVSANYVSVIKTSKKGKKGAKRGRKPGVAATTSTGVDTKQLTAAANFIKAVGGISAARQALSVAEVVAKAFA